MGPLNITEIVIQLVIIFLAIGIHEYAHAKLADMAGDPTPGIHGRVTLNLFNHFDPIGALFILMTVIFGFGFGWGRPVPMDPRRMRNPRWDHLIAVIGGPVSNILQAIIFVILFRIGAAVGISSPIFFDFVIYGTLINLFLAVFNMIPLGPLDGMWVVSAFLPPRMAAQWIRFNLTIGSFLFLGIILFGRGLFGVVIFPVVQAMARLLFGQPII